MNEAEQTRAVSNAGSKKQWQNVYAWGGVSTCIVLALLVLDIAISNILGGDITRIPATAAGRLQQFRENRLLAMAWMVLFALRLFRLAGNDQRFGASGQGNGKNALPA